MTVQIEKIGHPEECSFMVRGPLGVRYVLDTGGFYDMVKHLHAREGREFLTHNEAIEQAIKEVG
jgi:hypothetical protein